MPAIYKIVDRTTWKRALERGVFDGAAIDIQDGYIHLSAGHQVAETLEKHFAGRDNLLLVEIESSKFTMGDSTTGGQPAEVALRWEVSRNGEKFPHLYTSLDTTLVDATYELPIGVNGMHNLPPKLRQS